jgi:CubicO group peptidase (beta-lactamase class C family)
MSRLKLSIISVIMVILSVAFYFLNSAFPIGTGYTAKYLCSHIFLDNREPNALFQREIKPTHILFSLVNFEVDYDKKIVTTNALGFLKKTTALYREGVGCSLVINTTIDELKSSSINIEKRTHESDTLPYLENDKNKSTLNFDKEKLEEVLNKYFLEPTKDSNRNSRAILISQNGEIIKEKYSDGLNEKSLLLGWSMTKSVINSLIGILVKDNVLKISDNNLFPLWENDERKEITIDNLLRMSSGLEFEEVYGPLKDATYMLYDSKSCSDYAMNKKLLYRPGTFMYYSSGTTNLLSRLIFDKNGSSLEGNTNFLRERLLDKINMKSAILESDSSGVLIGSSYMFASARDWARFGYLYLNDGVFNGERILPEGWVKYSTEVTNSTTLGEYGAQIWLNRGNPRDSDKRKFPKLPSDLFYFGGYNKQIVAIIPSLRLVIVRLGVTTDDTWDHETFILDVLNSIVK